MRQVAQVFRLWALPEEILEVNWTGGIAGVALHVQDAGLGKGRMYQPGIKEIGRHLIHGPEPTAPCRRKSLKVVTGHPGKDSGLDRALEFLLAVSGKGHVPEGHLARTHNVRV